MNDIVFNNNCTSEGEYRYGSHNALSLNFINQCSGKHLIQ